jgi:hypothetical protein
VRAAFGFPGTPSGAENNRVTMPEACSLLRLKYMIQINPATDKSAF